MKNIYSLYYYYLMFSQSDGFFCTIVDRVILDLYLCYSGKYVVVELFAFKNLSVVTNQA